MMTHQVQHILSLLRTSPRNVWRLGDLKHWQAFQQHQLVALSFLKCQINYRTENLNQLKRSKRATKRWVHELMRHDLLVLMDKEQYFGIAIAMTEYHPENPTLDISKQTVVPAVRIAWIHQLAQPIAHPFTIDARQPDLFAPLDHLGFSMAETLDFLAKQYPEAITHLSDFLSSDYKKTVENQAIASVSMERLEEVNTQFPNPNVILYGPPGTGKTYQSIDLAVKITGRHGANRTENQQIFKQLLGQQIEFITFHQNYAYEDFIQGLRPQANAKKGLSFELRDGIFKRLANRATLNYLQSKPPEALTEWDDLLKQQLYQQFYPKEKTQQNSYSTRMPTIYSLNEAKVAYGKGGAAKKSLGQITELQNYVLIIDEINRANISSVFGELITLIERDKRYGQSNELVITLPSGELFVVPPNLYLIGTMNTADKSIALLDIALRRRFDFRAVYPCYDLPNLVKKEVLQAMNEALVRLRGRDFQIGHAYFLKTTTVFDWKQVMNQRVIPLLYEYFRGDERAVKQVLEAGQVSYEVSRFGLIEVN